MNMEQEPKFKTIIDYEISKPFDDGRINLTNQYLDELEGGDHLYHLALNRKDHNFVAMFGDVKFICMGGAANRMKKFARLVAERLNIPITAENPLVDITKASNRFSMYKVGPVLSVSHGMGVGSISILLNEVIKLVYYAECRNVTFFRIGTCGGIGVDPGTVVISKEAVDTLFQPYYTLHILGEIHKRPATFDTDLIDDLKELANKENKDYKIMSGRTMCANDFYETQCRRDGAFCTITENQRITHLNKLQNAQVVNIEMEATVFASMCRRAGIPGAIVCVTLLDRLQGDQVAEGSHEKYQLRPQEFVIKFIQQRLNKASNGVNH